MSGEDLPLPRDDSLPETLRGGCTEMVLSFHSAETNSAHSAAARQGMRNLSTTLRHLHGEFREHPLRFFV